MTDDLRLSQATMQQIWELERVIELHTRAMASHCECLGMNAENCQRAMLGQSQAYTMDEYLAVMHKWGLMTEKGEPQI